MNGLATAGIIAARRQDTSATFRANRADDKPGKFPIDIHSRLMVSSAVWGVKVCVSAYVELVCDAFKDCACMLIDLLGLAYTLWRHPVHS